jgi:hypothetical protein
MMKNREAFSWYVAVGLTRFSVGLIGEFICRSRLLGA